MNAVELIHSRLLSLSTKLFDFDIGVANCVGPFRRFTFYVLSHLVGSTGDKFGTHYPHSFKNVFIFCRGRKHRIQLLHDFLRSSLRHAESLPRPRFEVG